MITIICTSSSNNAVKLPVEIVVAIGPLEGETKNLIRTVNPSKTASLFYSMLISKSLVPSAATRGEVHVSE
jgi:hypothetical protein